VEEAIRRARAKAAERGLAVEFLVKDALTLGDWGERFASLIDSGLFHVFSHDDRRCYVKGLAQVIAPGRRLFLMCGSAEEPRDSIPRVSRQERWTASSIRRGHQIGGPRCPRGTPVMNFELIRGMLVLPFLPERPSIYGTESIAQDRAVVQTTLEVWQRFARKQATYDTGQKPRAMEAQVPIDFKGLLTCSLEWPKTSIFGQIPCSHRLSAKKRVKFQLIVYKLLIY
jgi:hypothetical protein